MSFMRMAPLCILVTFLNMIFAAQAVDLKQPSFVSVNSGERVTLNCTFKDAYNELIVWYKQKIVELPEEVGKVIANRGTQTSPEFDSLRFEVKKLVKINGASLTIVEAKKGDEGLYFCGAYTWGKFELSSATLVAVTDEEDVNVSVSQRRVLDSVPEGASVTLQCSVLSESRAAELQVLWFRAAPPQSHPQIIYTHHNSRHQCESGSSTHTCVYNFSKNILSLNDTGTYYCAVAACGKIIFGNGTRVQLKNIQHVYGFDSVVIYLAVALAVSVVLIFAQAFLHCKKLNLERNRANLSQGTFIEKTHNQDLNAVEMNYAALTFPASKTKSRRTKQRQPRDIVYSEVTYTPVT